MNPRLRIAIQNKGRLMQPSLDFLSSKGFKFKKPNNLVVTCENANLELLFVRCSDIPIYVEQKVVDFGIIGENILLEQNSKIPVLEKLSFGQCSLVIAIADKSKTSPANAEDLSTKEPVFQSLEKRFNRDLEGERIATSYPRSLQKYLRKKQINASIIKLKGSVELAPKLNLADAICDIRQSGRTLRENGLIEVEALFNSQAVLIGYSKKLWQKTIARLLRVNSIDQPLSTTLGAQLL